MEWGRRHRFSARLQFGAPPRAAPTEYAIASWWNVRRGPRRMSAMGAGQTPYSEPPTGEALGRGDREKGGAAPAPPIPPR